MSARYARGGPRDANEPELFSKLRAEGASIAPIAMPLDAVCHWGGHTFMLEVKTSEAKAKTPRKGRTSELGYLPNEVRLKYLSRAQRKFVDTWPGPWVVATDWCEVRKFVEWLHEQNGPR